MLKKGELFQIEKRLRRTTKDVAKLRREFDRNNVWLDKNWYKEGKPEWKAVDQEIRYIHRLLTMVKRM